MSETKFPDTYKGYSVTELLEMWDQIQSPAGLPKGTPEEKIAARSNFLREYKLGVHQYPGVYQGKKTSKS